MSKKRSTARTKRAKSKRSLTVKKSTAAAVAIATNAGSPIKARLAAMGNVTQEICADDDKLQAMLNVLRDTHEPSRVRLAALQALAAASFSVVQFEACRADYLATLRAVVADPDAELRQRVLGLLAREKDGFAQQRLIEGLEDPAKALVSAAKALQLLSYDVHADAYPLARRIVNNPPNPEAKREALRLLAADASSRPVFEQMLRDKKETAERHAREILLDASEPEALRATSRTALTQFGDAASVAGDDVLMKRVGALKEESSRLKQGAKRFLAKFER
jgi:hypothetical protein